MSTFDPSDHHWIVAGDETRLWSSKAGAYRTADDADYLTWRAAGGTPTRIASAFELDQVLRQHGLSIGRSFTAEEALEALGRVDVRRLKVALGRDDVRPSSLAAGDADKLRALAQELQSMPRAGTEASAAHIHGASKPLTLEERLAELETT